MTEEQAIEEMESTLDIFSGTEVRIAKSYLRRWIEALRPTGKLVVGVHGDDVLSKPRDGSHDMALRPY